MTHSRRIRSLFATALAVAVLAGCIGPACAQYNPYYPNPYAPGYGWGPGNTLAGAAQVIQAQGQLGIDQENARVQRQKAYQEKINTKKQAFDEAAYEKANTPAWIEEQDRIRGLTIRRLMNQPMPAEITRGDSLNTLLPFLKAMGDQGVSGPPVTVNPSLLKQMNVVVPNSGGGGTSAGLLKNGGKIAWPVQLRGPLQKKLDAILPTAVKDAAAGTLEPDTLTKIAGLIVQMQDDVRDKYTMSKIDGPSFLKGKRYLDDVSNSLKVLEDPDAAKFLSGSYAVEGNNVQEVVDNMTASGLKFGPASPGSDQAYFAMHNAFVSYARAAQSSGGMHSMLSSPPVPMKKGLK